MSENRNVHAIKNVHTIKQEIKDTLSLGIPLIASQLIYSLSNFIGIKFIGGLGEDALAASVLVTSIWITLSVVFFGILSSVSILVSHQYGANHPKAISRIMGQAFWLGFFITILMLFILSFMPLFLYFTKQPAIVHKIAKEYMYALLFTVPALILLIIYEQFLAGIHRNKVVLFISLIVVPIEIPLIYLLIFGKFGFPKCGVSGIGYGFAITYTLTAVLMTVYLARAKGIQKFGIFKSIKKIEWQLLYELFRVGLPIGLMHVVEVGTFAIATFWMAQFGTTMLAAHQIVMQYLNFFITIIFAMSQAVTIRVGNSVGRLDFEGVRYAIYVGMVVNFVCVIFVSLAFNLMPSFFLMIDNINGNLPQDLALARDAAMLLGICGLVMLFDNFRIIGFGALRGLKDTKFPMFASLFTFGIVGLGCAYIFGFNYNFEGRGIWYGLTAGIATGAFLIFMRIQYLLDRLNLHSIARIDGISEITEKV